MSILVTVAALLVASSTQQTVDPDSVPIATRGWYPTTEGPDCIQLTLAAFRCLVPVSNYLMPFDLLAIAWNERRNRLEHM